MEKTPYAVPGGGVGSGALCKDGDAQEKAGEKEGNHCDYSL